MGVEIEKVKKKNQQNKFIQPSALKQQKVVEMCVNK